jgi:hypothetical protein
MRAAFVVLLAASACLAGCHSKTGGNNASGQPAATASAPPAGAPQASAPQSGGVSAADTKIPRLKPGLWQVANEMTIDGKSLFGQGVALPKMQVCVDQSYDTNKTWRDQLSQGPSECGQRTLERRPDGALALHMTCTPKTGRPVIMEGLISGDYANLFKVDMTTTGTGSDGVKHVARMTMTQTRVGDCPAGMKGGQALVNGKPVTMGH